MKNFFFFSILIFLVGACALPLRTNQLKTPIPLFLKDELPQEPYVDIGAVSLHKELDNPNQYERQKSLEKAYNNLPEGWHGDEKDILLFQLAVKAKNQGADAVIHVQYSYYANKNIYGYQLNGRMVKFKE